MATKSVSALPGETLLEVLLRYQIGIRHDCGGVCHCTTCHLQIESGADFLEPPSNRELDFLKRVHNGTKNSRLACQCLLDEGSGILTVRIE